MGSLHVACNNPDNGLPMQKAPMLSIGDAEFECYGRSPTFVQLEGRKFRLAGKVWRFYSSQGGVGNWCWDSFDLCAGPCPTPARSLVPFLKWLRGRNLYSCTTGPTSLFDWFNSNQEKSDADVFKMISQCWSKPND